MGSSISDKAIQGAKMNRKIQVYYNSKTGFTKQYADWIAGELGCEASPLKCMSKADIAPQDVIVFGSRIHAGKIEKLKKVRKILASHPKSNIVIFAVGAAPAEVESNVQKIWEDNLSPDEIANIPHFYMQGGLDYERMGGFDRMLMKLFAKIMSKKKDKTAEEEGFSQAISSSYDSSSKEFIRPLIDCIVGKEAANA